MIFGKIGIAEERFYLGDVGVKAVMYEYTRVVCVRKCDCGHIAAIKIAEKRRVRFHNSEFLAARERFVRRRRFAKKRVYKRDEAALRSLIIVAF